MKKKLKEQYSISLDNQIKKIFVINDIGCGNCILLFSGYVKDLPKDEQSLVLINSRGYNVDLEAFQSQAKESSGIIISYKVISDPESLFYQSGVYYLNEGKVDTVIYIQPDLLKEQISYIHQRK